MELEVRYYHEFLVLAETKNYLEAGEALFISQSTLTRHIQAMEAELGAQLFDRTTRSVELSEYGRLLVPYAQHITREQSDCLTAFSNRKNAVYTKLIIGSIAVMFQYGITDSLVKYRASNPTIHLEVVEESSSILRSMVRQGKCDLAFAWESGEAEGLLQYVYSTDNLVVVLSKKHRLANTEPISLNELSSETFLMLPSGSFVNKQSMNACKEAGFEPIIGFTSQQESNVISLVALGMGVALMMRRTAEYYKNPDVVIHDISPSPSFNINVMCKNGMENSTTIRSFMKEINRQINSK